MIAPEEDRLVTLRESRRVLKPGGYFIFSSHNPVGAILSPRGLRSKQLWRWRLRFIQTRSFRKEYFRDIKDLLMYQATPANVIDQVTRHTDLRLEFSSTTRSGIEGPRPLTTLFSAWPYYVFKAPGRLEAAG